MVKERQDITGLNCIKGASGKVIVYDKGIIDSWKEYMEKLMNEENEFDHKISAGVEEGPADCIGIAEVRAVLKKMKRHKAPGLSGLVAEMIQAIGNTGTQWFLDLCNGIVKEGCIPGDWKSSVVLPVYKGKGDPMECGSYRGIKLLEHTMKVVEKIFEHIIWQQIEVDDMQFGFMKGRGTTDAIFMARQMQENFRVKGKKLYFGFVDLEKAFDRMPREVISLAMRKLGVEEWLVSAVMSVYTGAKTVIRTVYGNSKGFEVKMGMHQGSALSPLLFVIVMEAISREFRVALPWELLYVDNLAVIAETEEELIKRLNEWKDNVESKGMRVNMNKNQGYDKWKTAEVEAEGCKMAMWGLQ